MLRRSQFSLQGKSARSAGVTDLIEKWTPAVFKKTAVGLTLTTVALGATGFPVGAAVLGAGTALFTYTGYKDMNQNHHTLLKNFPVLARVRYALEQIRPEIRQYFIEDDTTEAPFSRDQRSLIYARSKGQISNQPFGTRNDVMAEGYSYVLHSMFPKPKCKIEDARVTIGAGNCAKPYSAAIFNTSAMSFGALSANAVRSFGRGAKIGGYYQNTGEGGLTPYHLENGNDLVWNIGTGYFSCRTPEGEFSEELFKKRAANEQVKMIEVKLSQGAKPS